jgi:hypothetical protein
MIIHYPPTSVYTYDPDTLSYLGFYAGDMAQTQRIAFDQLIVGLKADGLWTKIYQLMIYANLETQGPPYSDSYIGRLNLKDGSGSYPVVPFSPVAPNDPPPFTAWRGFDLGQAGPRTFKADAYPQFSATLSGGWTADNPGIRDDMSFGVWSLTDSQSSGGDMGMYQWDGTYDGNTDTYSNTYNTGWLLELRNASDELTYRVHTDTDATVTNTNSKGLFIANRSSGSAMSVSRNGVVLDTASVPSVITPEAAPYEVMGTQFGLGFKGVPVGATRKPPQAVLPSTFPYPLEQDVLYPSGREYCAHFVAQGLTATEQENLFLRLQDYFLVYISATDLGV